MKHQELLPSHLPAILTWVNGIFELLQPRVRLLPAALPGTLTSNSVGDAEVKAVIVAVK